MLSRADGDAAFDDAASGGVREVSSAEERSHAIVAHGNADVVYSRAPRRPSGVGGLRPRRSCAEDGCEDGRELPLPSEPLPWEPLPWEPLPWELWIRTLAARCSLATAWRASWSAASDDWGSSGSSGRCRNDATVVLASRVVTFAHPAEVTPALASSGGGGGGYGGGGGGGGFVLGGEEEETRRRGGEREVRSVKERPRRAVAPSLSLLEATARAAATLAAFSCEASPAAAEAKLVEGGAVGGCGGLVRAARPSPAAWVRKEEALPPVAVAVVGALAFALRELKTRARSCACVREGWTRRHKAT